MTEPNLRITEIEEEEETPDNRHRKHFQHVDKTHT